MLRLSLIVALTVINIIPVRVSARETVEDIIRRVWPDDSEQVALRVADRESRLRPNAIGCSGRCFGIFQIMYPVHRAWLRQMGIVSADQLLDAETNVRAALRLHELTDESWSPWCHSSGFPRRC